MKLVNENDRTVFGKDVSVLVNGRYYGEDYIPNWKEDKNAKLAKIVKSIKEDFDLDEEDCDIEFTSSVMTDDGKTGIKYDEKGNFICFI